MYDFRILLPIDCVLLVRDLLQAELAVRMESEQVNGWLVDVRKRDLGGDDPTAVIAAELPVTNRRSALDLLSTLS